MTQKKYENEDLIITWKPSECSHSTKCWTGLSSVFKPKERPWIQPEGATTEAIKKQIDACPSGALSYTMKNAAPENIEVEITEETIVEVAANGPLLVFGNLKVKDHLGNEMKKNKVTAFCRCGHSANKPFCDGTHRKVDFKDITA